MPRFKSIIFYQNSRKIKSFLKKIQNFSAGGLRRLGALPPDPQNSPPPLGISGYASDNFALFIFIGVFVGFASRNFF